ATWQSCLDHDPASEEAAGALIRAYLAQGRPELAARGFERCRVALEQLGLRISPSLERLYAPARDPRTAHDLRTARTAAPSAPETEQSASAATPGLTATAAPPATATRPTIAGSATLGSATLGPAAPPPLPREE